MGGRISQVHKCESRNPKTGKQCLLWPKHRNEHKYWTGSIFWVTGLNKEMWN